MGPAISASFLVLLFWVCFSFDAAFVFVWSYSERNFQKNNSNKSALLEKDLPSNPPKGTSLCFVSRLESTVLADLVHLSLLDI